MSALQDLSIPLLPGQFYHVFNRGNEKRHVFFERENYSYFLKKYAEACQAYLETFAYCLLDNHFHLLIRPKPHNIILAEASSDFTKLDKTFKDRYVTAWVQKNKLEQEAKGTDLTVLKELLNLMSKHQSPRSTDLHTADRLEDVDFETQLCSYLVSEKFRRFLLGYAKAINKRHGRTGSLFQKAFRRKRVEGINELMKVVAYIHHNPVHHHYTHDLNSYSWSSYNTIAVPSETRLNKSELLSWFGSVEKFFEFSTLHQKQKWEKEHFYIEDTL